MNERDLYFVDAFAWAPFHGNPAAVCLLAFPQPIDWMQSLAAELNLSETAFLLARADGWDLRWFTPVIEVSLCGHATLASAHVLWESGRLERTAPARFHTRSGVLTCFRDGNKIAMDFPAAPVEAIDSPEKVIAALGVRAVFVGQTTGGHAEGNLLVQVATEAVVRGARPDFAELRRATRGGVILTAASDDARHDFVSRFFAPYAGIDEDPVTGSAHCSLGPFWAERLEKRELTGFQASRRGGLVFVCRVGERVKLSGQAVTLMRGQFTEDVWRSAYSSVSAPRPSAPRPA
jgi:PhzF family phenazine biosynthesis protein